MKWSEFFDYDDGVLIRKRKPEITARDKQWNTKYSGPVNSNKLRNNGYLVFMIDGVKVNAHRVIYEMHNGEIPCGFYVDHINGIRSDNRIENLRIVTCKGNNLNMGLAKNNTSGVVGVYWNKRRCNWTAGIKVDGKYLELGAFSNFDDAVSARKDAEVRYGFYKNGRRGGDD